MKKIICLLGILTVLLIVSSPVFADPYPLPDERMTVVSPITTISTIHK